MAFPLSNLLNFKNSEERNSIMKGVKFFSAILYTKKSMQSAEALSI